jgi:hypothetical protein
MLHLSICGRYSFEIASGIVPCTARPREFVGRAGRLVAGSQPGLARRVRKAHAMVVRRPLFVRTNRLVAFPDHLAFSGPEGVDDGLRDGPETTPDGRFRGTKGSCRASERAGRRRRRRARVAEHPPTPRRRTEKLRKIVRRPQTTSHASPNW